MVVKHNHKYVQRLAGELNELINYNHNKKMGPLDVYVKPMPLYFSEGLLAATLMEVLLKIHLEALGFSMWDATLHNLIEKCYKTEDAIRLYKRHGNEFVMLTKDEAQVNIKDFRNHMSHGRFLELLPIPAKYGGVDLYFDSPVSAGFSRDIESFSEVVIFLASCIDSSTGFKKPNHLWSW